MKKILAIVLAVTLSMLACSCNCGNKVESEKIPSHQYEKTESGEFIVKDGESKYSIVIPSDSSPNEKTAAEELLVIFEKATGITLPIVSEDSYDGDYAIYLGDTEYSEEYDGDYNKEPLGESGFRITTEDYNLIIYGKEDIGTVYGVYGFLTDLVNFEPFTQDYFYVDDMKEVKHYIYDVTDIPDLQVRMTGYDYVRNDKTLLNRMRAISMYDYFETLGNKLFHNTFGVLPKSEHQAQHPKWYSDDYAGFNLCFSARGDEVEYEAMMEEVLKDLKQYIIDHPESKHITFTHEDNNEWCPCSACSTIKMQYGGANSAVLIHFMNDLRTRIDAWMDSDEGAHKIDFDLIFFAYHATNAPPVKKNSDGEYEPIDETVVLKDGVVPYFAESNGDYTRAFTEGEINTPYAENLKGWKALTDEVICWIYGSNMTNPFTIYDTFSAAPTTYRFFIENGAKMMFEESSSGGGGQPVAFGVLKHYLFSKLTWNIDLDIDELYDRFFNLYYQDAAESMREYFDNYRQWAYIQKNQLGYEGGRSIFLEATQAKFWPQRTVDQWYALTEKAMNDIEEVKDIDQELYLELYDNISADRLSTLYLMLTLYKDKYTKEEQATYKRYFVDDTLRLGHSGTYVQDIYDKIGA